MLCKCSGNVLIGHSLFFFSRGGETLLDILTYERGKVDPFFLLLPPEGGTLHHPSGSEYFACVHLDDSLTF